MAASHGQIDGDLEKSRIPQKKKVERKLDLQQEKKDASGFHRERKIKQKQNNNIINFIKKKKLDLH